MATQVYKAYVNLTAGDYVTLIRNPSNYSEFVLTKAIVNPYSFYIGFVKNNYTAGTLATVYIGVVNDALAGLTVGAKYYADPTVPGGITSTSPTGTFVIQVLGSAISSTELNFQPDVYVGTFSGSPTGPAGGDLSGTYPNPSVLWANSYPTLDLRYYPLSSNPAGYITSAALAPYLTSATAAATYLSIVTAAATYQPLITTGTTAQYFRGDLSLATFPTNVSSFTNDSGYITSAALAPYLTSATAAATYVALAGSYSNPSWITDLAWSKITGTPTTLAGYGITNGVATTRTLTINGTAQDLSADRTWTVGDVLTSGSYANPSWITSLAYSKLTGAPTIPTVTPSALTKVDDTNVTLTLGGTPSTALLQAVSLTLGWTGTLADARIASAATWNAKVSGKAYTSVTNSTAITGTTANTLADSVLVVGGTYVVGEIIHVMARAIKTGTAGTSTIRVYVNTTAAIAGATLVSTWTTTAAANLFFQSERYMMIKSATNTQVANSSASSAIDNAQIGAVSTLNIDWTTDKYFVFAIQNGNNADSTVISGYRVKDY